MRLLWARSVPAGSTPGRLYLALRFAWPAAGIGLELPATVRWLAREAAPGKVEAAEARRAGAGDAVHVAEGDADALALSLAPWCAPGAVYAVGGTAGKGTVPALR